MTSTNSRAGERLIDFQPTDQQLLLLLQWGISLKGDDTREREREREYNSFNITILIPKTVSFPSFLPFSEAHRRRSNYSKLLIIHAPLISFLLKIQASPLRTSLLLLYYENKNEANIDRSFIHVQSSLEMDNNRIL